MSSAPGQHAADARRTRVLVVDDSALCRDLLVDVLCNDPSIEVAGMAVDGADAVKKVAELHPDVVTMDLRMPVMDGIEATKAIMAETPTPVLVLTGHPFQSGRNMTFDAIRAGALDLMIKPDLGNLAEVQELAGELTRLVKFLARIEVRPNVLPGLVLGSLRTDGDITVICIAAAAGGGPGALQAVLRELPANFPACVLVVQRMAEGFSREFAAWLAKECPMTVREARDGDELRPGTCLVAPAEGHLRVMPGGICRILRGAPINGVRPSADVLLSSVARLYRSRACAVILSGMGEDGVAGMAEVKEKEGYTIAQDEGTSAVYGMPGAAVNRGVVDAVLPVGEIAKELMRLVTRPS